MVFSVKDNGIGIPEGYQQYIFEPFKTLENKTLQQKAGLGLAIVKNIIEKYGGSVWLESSPTEGSKFNFSLLRDD